MDRLQAMTLFSRVVQTGSFAAAARELGLSRAMASKGVSELEAGLGVRLLNRTTRQISLTEPGTGYYQRVLRVLGDLAEAEDEARLLHARPRGTLRLNAPMSFGVLHVAPLLPAFLRQYPEVSVDLTLNDRLVDLIEDGFDLAIRIARLADSSMIARRLAPCRLVVCASPAYLAAAGTPEHPADLASHDCLGYAYSPQRDEWVFRDGTGGEQRIRVRGRLKANNGDVLRAAALDGLGIVLQPSFLVGPDLRAGRLVPLLPAYRTRDIDVSAVYPPTRHLSAKVRSFIDFLAERFGPEPPWDEGL